MVASREKYRFTTKQYHRIGEIGIFPPDARVELLDGLIRRMAPIHPPHASIVDRLTTMLAVRLQGIAIVRVQNPIRLDDYNEPQPDVTVLRFRDDYYARRHPTPAEVLLAIEVADTSLSYDRDEKMPLYGRAGIPEAWLVDVRSETITVFTEPRADGYGQQRMLSRGQKILSENVEGLRLQIDEVLG